MALSQTTSEHLRSYYEARHADGPLPSQQVGWKNDQAQQNRFDQLLRLLPPTGFSLNDFGCGLGDFAPYLKQAGFNNFTYTGYDMFQSMVDRAREKQHEHVNLQFFTIDRPALMHQADFTVASGVFNIRFDVADADWFRFILDTLHIFNDKSRKGFAFNALTRYADAEFMRSDLYYADPLVLFDYCKKNFSKNIALLHDYQEFDFTILVRK